MRVLPAIMLLGALGVGSAVAVVLCGPVPVMDWVADPIGSLQLERGENPAPVALIRPDAAPLSDYAELGKLIFFDKTLSSSGQLACASCHSPRLFYGPPNGDPAMFGGPALAGISLEGRQTICGLAMFTGAVTRASTALSCAAWAAFSSMSCT